VDTALTVPKEHRRFAIACHLAAAGGLVVLWVGFGLGPLITWLAVRDEHPSLDAHGREAIQFNVSMMIWMAAGGALRWLLGPLGWFIPGALLALWLACVVMAAVKAGEGEFYRYPVTVRFLK
jgi:uncharacterized Tic20 family protein